MRLIALTLFSAIWVVTSPVAAQDPLPAAEFAGPFRADLAEATAISARCDEYVDEIVARSIALESQVPPYTIDRTLRAYDDLMALSYFATSEAGAIRMLWPTEEVRNAASDCSARLSELYTRIEQSRGIYDRLSAIDASQADEETRYYLGSTLAEFERAGISLSDEQKARFQAIKQEISVVIRQFQSNYANARATLFAREDELAGLPEDYLASHPPDEDGLIEISSDAPDSGPVMAYAHSHALRRRLFQLSSSLAYPENSELIGRLLVLRQQLATLLGRDNFAALQFEDKMLNSVEEVENHIAELHAATEAAANNDIAMLQSAMAEQRPGHALTLPDYSYASQLALRSGFDLDRQEVRQYFSYNNTRDGIFQLAQDLFGIEILTWDTPVWHGDVESFRIYEDGQLIGQFYIDGHPRDGKFKTANHRSVRTGASGGAIPTSILTLNLPKGDHDTGLLEHGQVVTFLHEFGHLLHSIFAGRQEWFGQSGVSAESDFNEAPSQMLEEWIYDYETVSRFARNAEGEPIPYDLFEKIRASQSFGLGLTERFLLAFSEASLRFYLGPPASLSADAISTEFRTYANTHAPIPFPDYSHREATWSHVTGYGAAVYTYGWSRVIAADLFSRFEEAGLRDRQTAMDYRKLVLEPGGSKPAVELVEAFLGRSVRMDAKRRQLERDAAD